MAYDDLTDGKNTFYRMELERRTSSGSTTFSFDVNPQSFDESIDPQIGRAHV